ncbi:hypothetical protein RIF29_36091 [Crotalaria pallida]|uniref:Uncharacterized protein n=1 Tax=Crotalaria pallida TaxID=3830 RepID=A0AAN9HVJ4_CROPI
MKEANRITEAIVPSQPPYQHAPETDVQNPFQSSRVEGHGLQRRRRQVIPQNVNIEQINDRAPGMYYVPSQEPNQQSEQWFWPPLSPQGQTTPNMTPSSSFPNVAPSSSFPNMASSSSFPNMAPSSSFPYYTRSPYVPSSSSPSCYTPAPFIPSSSSQPCYAPFVHHIQETPMSPMLTPGYGIDLNANFTAVASPSEELSQPALFEEIRRNPHRGARDRRRHCILSPPDDNEDDD